jgi:hypothetical protein
LGAPSVVVSSLVGWAMAYCSSSRRRPGPRAPLSGCRLIASVPPTQRERRAALLFARRPCVGRDPEPRLLVVALPPACRLRGGRFDRLPPLESLFSCWPKRSLGTSFASKVTQREWPETPAASCWDKPERLRMVVADLPWEATQRALQCAAQRARIAEDLKPGLAAHRLWRASLACRLVCGSAPCARQTYGAVRRGVAVAHRVRSHT